MTENIQVFIQNSIRIETAQGAIYVDPFQMKETPKDAAFVCVTHDHYDHFSADDIAKVACESTVLIVPEKMEKKAREVAGMVSKIITVKPGESYAVDGLSFETVASYNLLKPFHPKSAEWVGYVFLVDGKRIYVAGDTDATKEAKAVKCDVALIPIGGTYTMDPKKAAELINEMQPAVAIPVHYGNLVGKPSYGEEFAALVKEPTKVEFKIKF
ncbi:MAG: MBL fold metallo-hydrolase [Lachnospiraceae bacterium]|jgi:L-ascorbate metabolism protein UlaG (beta-lactamase superfamily)|nr:MBL fold metallo-hydrolase [Lachnospiraceae bacterium]